MHTIILLTLSATALGLSFVPSVNTKVPKVALWGAAILLAILAFVVGTSAQRAKQTQLETERLRAEAATAAAKDAAAKREFQLANANELAAARAKAQSEYAACRRKINLFTKGRKDRIAACEQALQNALKAYS